MNRPDDLQLANTIGELREILDQLDNGIPTGKRGQRSPNLAVLLRRAKKSSRRDGHRTNSLGGGNGTGPVAYVTEDEDPIDPGPVSLTTVEAALIGDTSNDPILRLARDAVRGLTSAVGDLRMSRDALGKAFTLSTPRPDLDGCRNHAQVEIFEPTYSGDRCRWCYDFQAAYRVDAGPELLEARARGQRITQPMVDQYLRTVRANRTRKRDRRRRAS